MNIMGRTYCSLRHIYRGVSLSTASSGKASTTAKLSKKPKSEKTHARRFVDFVRLRVTGGEGGNGCVSFLNLFSNEYAGPDGGDGGNGAHVVFQADSNIKSLVDLSTVQKADNGDHGRNNHCHGKSANHQFIKVPVGTLFKSEDHQIVADLRRDGDIFIAARGGAGGRGNHFFRSSENQAPTSYEKGGQGEIRAYLAELRVMAHVGLVGFPNAGKSTLLRAISRARPKVAAYPFTTLNPHVGIVEYDDHEQVAVADIPGLIPGAHQNHGLGVSFLRHIERCVCLLYVLDLSHDRPWWQLDKLRYELNQYSPGLADRPHAIVANKLDLPMAEDNLKALQERVDMPVFALSAKRSINVGSLLADIRLMYEQHKHNHGHIQ